MGKTVFAGGVNGGAISPGIPLLSKRDKWAWESRRATWPRGGRFVSRTINGRKKIMAIK